MTLMRLLPTEGTHRRFQNPFQSAPRLYSEHFSCTVRTILLVSFVLYQRSRSVFWALDGEASIPVQEVLLLRLLYRVLNLYWVPHISCSDGRTRKTTSLTTESERLSKRSQDYSKRHLWNPRPFILLLALR